ncbi:MAG: sigma-54 dependent transcriptional regulator [Myxococcales bacterium]|nr:sigma-54 dependent transcriptional regulator [Myxococcales bacterium]
MSRILVVEDELVLRSELRRLLVRSGYQVDEASSLEETEAYSLESFDLILTDLRLPGGSGTELLKGKTHPPIVIMTSYATVASAVEAMKRGAADYISKPFEPDELKLTIANVLKSSDHPLASEVQPETALFGRSPPMQQVKTRISKVAATDSIVLILGESGTGKELVARSIHRLSSRSNQAFVAVNCAAIPDGLVESELFGHEQGAFTGANQRHIGLIETAHKGTLLLDEIGELSLSAQARLLRVLQQREVRLVGSNKTIPIDVRILAATHQDLRVMVAERRFREDLYYRLHVLEIELPPLRDRGDDILALAEQLFEQAKRKVGRTELTLSASAKESIKKHLWPGNVRELANAIERAVVLAEGSLVNPSLFRLSVPRPLDHGPNAHETLSDYFTQFVLKHQDHLSETEIARRLGISRKSLWEKRRRLGIPKQSKQS